MLLSPTPLQATGFLPYCANNGTRSHLSHSLIHTGTTFLLFSDFPLTLLLYVLCPLLRVRSSCTVTEQIKDCPFNGGGWKRGNICRWINWLQQHQDTTKQLVSLLSINCLHTHTPPFPLSLTFPWKNTSVWTHTPLACFHLHVWWAETAALCFHKNWLSLYTDLKQHIKCFDISMRWRRGALEPLMLFCWTQHQNSTEHETDAYRSPFARYNPILLPLCENLPVKKHQHSHTMLVSSWAVPADAMTCLCSSLFCWLLATLLTKATVKDRKLNKEAVSSELFPQPLLFSKAKITVFIF